MTTQQTLQTEEYKQTELGELPKDWSISVLGDIAEVFDKKRVPLSVDVRAKRQGIYPYCGANGIIDYIDNFIFDGKFVLLAEDGGYWGAGENSAYIMNGKFWVNNHAHILKAISGKTINQFLFYALNHIDMNPLIGGDARGKLTQTIMRTIQIPLPPLSEQQKIAHVLSTIQTAQEKTQNFINSLKELKKSAMKHLFTYGAVSFEDIDKVELKETEIGMMPKDWDVVKLEYCLSDKKVKVSKLQQSQFLKIGKFPIVDQSQDLIAGYWDNEEDLFSSPLPIIIFGDHTRTFKFIDFPFVCGPDGTKILIPEISKVFPNFFYYALKLLKIPSRGYNRHYSLLKDYLIPLPPPPEQQRIASILSAIDEKIQAEEQKKEALKETFNSLLKNLMTAKIRVNDLEVGA